MKKKRVQTWVIRETCMNTILGRPRRMCLWRGGEDNIKMNLREIECDGMDWIELAQDRDQRRTLVNAVMNLRVP
jgi:hypothetical protein